MIRRHVVQAICLVLLSIPHIFTLAFPLEGGQMATPHPSVPEWASDRDLCIPTRRCSDCTKMMNLQKGGGTSDSYCSYSTTGQARCCAPREIVQRVQDSWFARSKKTTLTGGGVPNTLPEPLPEWASSSDVCTHSVSCDACAKVQYCLLSSRGHKSACCSSQQHHTLLQEQQVTESALSSEFTMGTISPVAKNPIPAWAQIDKDHCVRTTSCDECAPSVQYCRYSSIGVPRCCSKPSNIPVDAPVQIAQHAGEAPEHKEPIPSWASAADVCVTARTCDLCSTAQYCKYVGVGKSISSQCCSAATEEHKHEHRIWVASSNPIDADPTPAWADPKTDLCLRKVSCDECMPVTEYCHYSSKGEPSCCGKADRKVIVPTEQAPSAPATAEDGADEPITTPNVPAAPVSPAQIPLPDWAQPEKDQCAKVSSCTQCERTATQYCRAVSLAPIEEARCCVPENDPHGPVVTLVHSDEHTSSRPDWASSADICVRVPSCDVCQSDGEKQYCKPSSPEQRDSFCCRAALEVTEEQEQQAQKQEQPQQQPESPTVTPAVPAPVIELIHDDLPGWSSSSDLCAVVSGACSTDCPASVEQYCKHDAGLTLCCKPKDVVEREEQRGQQQQLPDQPPEREDVQVEVEETKLPRGGAHTPALKRQSQQTPPSEPSQSQSNELGNGDDIEYVEHVSSAPAVATVKPRHHPVSAPTSTTPTSTPSDATSPVEKCQLRRTCRACMPGERCVKATSGPVRCCRTAAVKTNEQLQEEQEERAFLAGEESQPSTSIPAVAAGAVAREDDEEPALNEPLQEQSRPQRSRRSEETDEQQEDPSRRRSEEEVSDREESPVGDAFELPDDEFDQPQDTAQD